MREQSRIAVFSCAGAVGKTIGIALGLTFYPNWLILGSNGYPRE